MTKLITVLCRKIIDIATNATMDADTSLGAVAKRQWTLNYKPSLSN